MNKKGMALLLSACLCTTAIASGCNGNRVGNDDQTLEIYTLVAGYGRDWLDALVEEFKKQDWVKEKYPELKVAIPNTNREWSYAPNRIKAGGAINTADLMFGVDLQKVYAERDKEGKPLLADLRDVYDSTVPGEEIMFSDKVIDSFLESNRFYDKDLQKKVQYGVTWAAGMDGIYYNDAYFEANGWEIPLTTDELVGLCKTIHNSQLKSELTKNTVFPFVQSSNTAYWRFMFPIWWAQYEGVENYKNYYSGVVNDYLDSAVIGQTGRLRSLECIESLLSGDNGYLHENSGALQYRDAQVRFLLGEGVMQVNGDWFNTEMQEDMKVYTSAKVKVMRTPVLSSLIEKTPSIGDDATLHKVIEAVDAGESGYEGVTAADFKKVKEARSIIESIGPNHLAVIPDYASAKELAKDFLRFMATDIANETYIRAMHGASMPFKYNVKEKAPAVYAEVTEVQRTRIDVYSDANVPVNVLPSPYAYPLYTYGKVLPITSYTEALEFAFYNKTYTAKEIFDNDVKYWTANDNKNWNTAVALANLH